MRRGAGPCIGGQKNLRPLGLVRHRPGSAEKCPVRPGQVWYTKVTPAIKWQIQQGAREIRPLRDVRRRAAGRHQGDRTLVYLYDFGDGWEHTIKIERLAVPEPGEFYPRLVEVAGRCPPEDCGGPWGYAELLAAIKDPRHERHAELTEWIGDYFDPNADDAEELTAEVGTLARAGPKVRQRTCPTPLTRGLHRRISACRCVCSVMTLRRPAAFAASQARLHMGRSY
jgi:Plasmid pRiA4b ORF-3-like protein